MSHNVISRRRFLEQSITGGMAVSLDSASRPFLRRFGAMTADGTGLTLKVTGDDKLGYGVALLFNGQLFARHHQGGEFSAVLQNEDRSVVDRVTAWKASSWAGDATRVTLAGECKLQNLNATVYVQVDYEVTARNVVRKRIRLQQADMFMLFYQLANRLEPVDVPARFWSFDQLNWGGEPLREYFPSAGFRTKSGLCVGLLTDSGARNQWTRLIRRDGRPVKPAPRRVPDAHLYSGSQAQDRAQGNYFIQQTFGEVLEQRGEQGAEAIVLPEVSSWKKQGPVTLDDSGGVATITMNASDAGVLIPFRAESSEFYALQVEYRSTMAPAIEIWSVDEQLHRISDLTQYNDGAPESPGAWSEFKTTTFISGVQRGAAAIFISLASSEQGRNMQIPAGGAKIEIRKLQIRRMGADAEPYHRLEMGRTAEKTMFTFADEKVPDSVRGHRQASQLYLADGLGFRGGETEKTVYADLMMLSWIAGPEDFQPMCAPSIWYSAAGEMYLRDSFFAANGIHNRELNENIFSVWGENQGSDGSINTLIEANLANVERKSNDSTPLWLMWALLNRSRFGTKLPMEKIRKAAEYCLRTYDPHRNGLCSAQFVMGQLDVIRYPEGTSAICENQGMLAVTLRAIQQLQIPEISDSVSEEHIVQAEDLYRSYYDTARKFLRPARGVTEAIGFAEIFPEYLSLWFFNRKMLTDEMVVNHLDRIPVMMPHPDCPHPAAGGTVRPILIGLPEDQKSWKYFNEKWHPMISDSFAAGYANHAADGIYYNGGSWMRIEICGYVTGKLHGWSNAKMAIENRLWAELHTAPDFPTSQEYLATDAANPFFGFHRVFAWNSFILQALELAGMRTPEMDPDYRRK
jgi:hypothetical protein